MEQGDSSNEAGAGDAPAATEKKFTEREVKGLIGFFAGIAAAQILESPEAYLDATEDPEAAEAQANYALAIFEFGKRHEWPPAETFARQTCELNRKPFPEDAWREDPRWRARFETMRAVLKALADVDLGIDPKLEPKPTRRARRDPDDDAFERHSGAFDRERIGGARPSRRGPDGAAPQGEGKEGGAAKDRPVIDVHGVGAATAAQLEKIGVRTVGDLAALDVAKAAADLAPHLRDRLPALKAAAEAMALDKSS